MTAHIHPVFERLLSEFTANVRTAPAPAPSAPDPLEDYAQAEIAEQQRREREGFEAVDALVVWVAPWVERARL